MKCAIAYDNDKGRDGLRSLVSANRDWELCADARIDRDAYELALKTQPDVVVMDVAVPAFGISLARLLRDDLPGASCLLFTNVYGIDTVTSAVAADVKGYVLKREGQHVLAAAINMLGAGSRYYSPAVVDIIVEAADKPLRREPKAFTLRELEITRLVANGYTNKNIAHLLGVSPRTVEFYRGSAMRKAGAHSGSELVRFAMRYKLIA